MLQIALSLLMPLVANVPTGITPPSVNQNPNYSGSGGVHPTTPEPQGSPKTDPAKKLKPNQSADDIFLQNRK